MKIIKTKFKDLLVFKSKNFYDYRGYFREISLQKLIKKRLIFTVVSKSRKDVLRGLHFQKKNSQGKYLSVLKGEIFDVALDCRPRSKTFGKHFKIFLSDKNSKSIFQLNLPNKLKKFEVVIFEKSSKEISLSFDKNFTVCII